MRLGLDHHICGNGCGSTAVYRNDQYIRTGVFRHRRSDDGIADRRIELRGPRPLETDVGAVHAVRAELYDVAFANLCVAEYLRLGNGEHLNGYGGRGVGEAAIHFYIEEVVAGISGIYGVERQAGYGSGEGAYGRYPIVGFYHAIVLVRTGENKHIAVAEGAGGAQLRQFGSGQDFAHVHIY